MSVPSSPKTPVLAIVGMFALALAGVGLLALALFSLLNEPAQTAAPTVTAAATVGEVVFVPTTTPAPATATLEPTTEPTEVPPTTDAPAATTVAPASQVINIIQPANVRSGPGTNYPILGGINTGETAAVVGRDGTGTWFAVSTDLPGATGGVGWVSNLVATFDGDTSSLPVV